jgi:cysteine desulfurase
LNVTGIVGLGKAAEIAKTDMESDSRRVFALREKLRKGIMDEIPDVYINGHAQQRLAGNLNISFAYVEGESLLMGISDIAVSSGSACTSASLEPSYVLKALGVGEELAHSSIRFGLGRFNTDEEVDYTIGRVNEAVNRLRELSPLWEMVQEGVDLSKVQWAGE